MKGGNPISRASLTPEEEETSIEDLYSLIATLKSRASQRSPPGRCICLFLLFQIPVESNAPCERHVKYFTKLVRDWSTEKDPPHVPVCLAQSYGSNCGRNTLSELYLGGLTRSWALQE